MRDEHPLLAFGGTGQLGRALVRRRGDRPIVALGRVEADVTRPAAIGAALDRHLPGIVVNCSVFQPVDRCETEVRRAFEVNALAAGNIAAECAGRNVGLIHVSTDYVFDGAARSGYDETACPNPLNVYGRSKLAGEHLVLTAGGASIVVRTSSVYGPVGERGTASFVERMLQRANAGESTRVVDDQVVSPTYVDDLADAVWRLVDAELDGIVHISGQLAASWYEVAEQVFRAAGRQDLLSPTSAADFGAAARRPPFSALRSTRSARFGIEALPGVDDGLRRFLAAAHPELAGNKKPEAG